MDYASIPGVNPSSLKILARKSPLHFQYAQTHPRAETPAMRLGTAVHLAVLQPDLFATSYAVKPEGMSFVTKEGKEWRAANSDRPILSSEEYADICGMADAVRAHPEAARYLAAGAVEEPIVWTDPDTGVAMKGRPDLVTSTGFLVDLKTARDLTPRRFASAVLDLGYLFSMAAYKDGLALNGKEPRETVLVCVESSAPFDVCVYRLDDDALDIGRGEYKQALETLKECRERNEWPGRLPGVATLNLPSWAYPEEDDAEGLEFGEEG